MINPSVKPSAPTTAPAWAKKLGSSIYRAKVKKMVEFLTLGQPLSRHERAKSAHYWLDVQTVEEGRRLRSPAERLVDKAADSRPKSSVAY